MHATGHTVLEAALTMQLATYMAVRAAALRLLLQKASHAWGDVCLQSGMKHPCGIYVPAHLVPLRSARHHCVHVARCQAGSHTWHQRMPAIHMADEATPISQQFLMQDMYAEMRQRAAIRWAYASVASAKLWPQDQLQHYRSSCSDGPRWSASRQASRVHSGLSHVLADVPPDTHLAGSCMSKSDVRHAVTPHSRSGSTAPSPPAIAAAALARSVS